MLASAACTKSSPPAPEPEKAAAASPSGAKPDAAPSAPAAAPTEGALPVLKHDGKSFTFRTAMIWVEKIAGSTVPQFILLDGEFSCADRATAPGNRFFASLIGSGDGLEPGEYRSPNWGFTGLPEFNPSPESLDDQEYPPAYWGTLTVSTVTDASVTGTVHYTSKGVTLEGPFTAKRCQPTLSP